MYYVYIIKSKNNNPLYIGTTPNLKRRLEEHNNGESEFTAKNKPWVYAYIEGYFNKEDALSREKSLKYFGKVYAQLKRRIKNSLQDA
ncbi:MAG: GIY-YIG nuclease family protein [Patescibacteria group bacterium]